MAYMAFPNLGPAYLSSLISGFHLFPPVCLPHWASSMFYSQLPFKQFLEHALPLHMLPFRAKILFLPVHLVSFLSLSFLLSFFPLSFSSFFFCILSISTNKYFYREKKNLPMFLQFPASHFREALFILARFPLAWRIF